MKKITIDKTVPALIFTLLFLLAGIQISVSQTFCTQVGTEQFAGEQDGYRYELWNQYGQGTACMTIDSGALFSGEWDSVENYLARRGLGYDETKKHQEIGTFSATYDCSYNPSSESGNSYLSVYGWTVNPLKEFYIVEDWRNWIPSMAAGSILKGTIAVNGSTYDIYESTRTNQPSIIGNTTFKQYFSIRRDVRNSGEINISEHFEKWETLGMEMGYMYEVSFVVEGYKSSGSFIFNELDVSVTPTPVSSVDMPTESYQLRLYPNPNMGELSIELGEDELFSDVRIYDISGKICFYQESADNERVHVSDLQRGVYILNISNNSLNYTSRFLVF